MADRDDPRVVIAALAGGASLARSQGDAGGPLASLLGDAAVTIHRLIDMIAARDDATDRLRAELEGVNALVERMREAAEEREERCAKVAGADTRRRRAATKKGRKR